jgi:hypothetical protein
MLEINSQASEYKNLKGEIERLPLSKGDLEGFHPSIPL